MTKVAAATSEEVEEILIRKGKSTKLDVEGVGGKRKPS